MRIAINNNEDHNVKDHSRRNNSALIVILHLAKGIAVSAILQESTHPRFPPADRRKQSSG
jgi:hypothetical protein